MNSTLYKPPGALKRSWVCALIFAITTVLAFQLDAQAQRGGNPNPNPPGLSLANPAVAIVAEVQDEHSRALLAIPGVVGTGTGLDDNGRLAIKVFTDGPGVPGIPQALNGIPVDVEVTGMFHAFVDTTARFDRPTPIGVSTGHPDITAGTIGCRVVGTDGNGNSIFYALSNNHVYANSNEASFGDPELQPGPYDGGVYPEDVIGSLVDFEPIAFDGTYNKMDAAIALLSETQPGIPDVGAATPGDGYGTPASDVVQNVNLQQKVQKYGRTTGHTKGQVTAVNVTVEVCYEARGPFLCVKLARFVDQIIIEPGGFSAGGDSGSLIVTDDANRKPVGLLFAGSDSYTIANPIGPVLQRFDVVVDDGSFLNGNQPPVADFTYTVDDVALTVDFTDTSTDMDGTVSGWSWEFGDGASSTSQNPQHQYGDAGLYEVMLTVTDDEGAVDMTTQSVAVGNQAPVADFTFSVSGLDVNFTDASNDPDGTIASWAWDFDDGNTSTSQNPQHTYAAGGDYLVTLKVTDDEGAQDSTSQTVSVTDTSGIQLSVTAEKVKGERTATLSWSGAGAGAQMDIYRDGNRIDTSTSNESGNGTYIDSLGKGGSAIFTYQVCESSGTACSNEAVASF